MPFLDASNSKHEGAQDHTGLNPRENLINTSQPHSKIVEDVIRWWEYIICDLYHLAHSDLSSSNTLFSTNSCSDVP